MAYGYYCKTYFQCPCCKEVFEIEVEAIYKSRSFVDKDGGIIKTEGVERVNLFNVERVPTSKDMKEATEEEPKKAKKPKE